MKDNITELRSNIYSIEKEINEQKKALKSEALNKCKNRILEYVQDGGITKFELESLLNDLVYDIEIINER